MKDVYLHNPRCTKSRQGLAALEERGVDVPVREYLKDPPTEKELRQIVKLLGIRPIEMVRRGEDEFKKLRLSDSTPDDEVIRAMAEHPILIERPVLVRGNKAAIGRPTEKLLEILQGAR
jgi:arsenate reductase